LPMETVTLALEESLWEIQLGNIFQERAAIRTSTTRILKKPMIVLRMTPLPWLYSPIFGLYEGR
jgi:hypothetical protein